MSEKISKIEAMYRYYKANPVASNGEVGQALGLSGDMVRTYKNRLKRNGLIYIEDDGRISTEREVRKCGEMDYSLACFKQFIFRLALAHKRIKRGRVRLLYCKKRIHSANKKGVA